MIVVECDLCKKFVEHYFRNNKGKYCSYKCMVEDKKKR